jgi:hypothetical protein
MAEHQVLGLPMSQVKDAILFHQRFKETPTYVEMMKRIKREHLELELVRINKELGELE